MLYEQADETYYLTIVQIMDQLEKTYDITTSHEIVGNDIIALAECEILNEQFRTP